MSVLRRLYDLICVRLVIDSVLLSNDFRMDERRAIFEHFVKHRREDMKAEKKQKLKQAKQLFTQLLDDQFKAGALDTKMTLSMFLSTLEDRLDAARNKETQDESFAYLTISIQEKLYGKAVRSCGLGTIGAHL